MIRAANLGTPPASPADSAPQTSDERRAPVTIEALAGLSHEFRTPLNGVLGLTRLLEATSLTGEQRSYVDALKESGEHLLGLVNQLLDFARLGASAIRVQTEDV
ncbi:MAG: ATPase, partial [Phenylobacterium sp.]|nr:ATPase [Phenylobacterium sp.]